MKTKPTWTATNEAGAKLYYYEGLGWIDSSTGLVTGFDTRDMQFQPDDATHVWINSGRVNFLKEHRAFPGQFEIWDGACWGDTVKQLKGVVVVPLGGGTVVTVSDGYVDSDGFTPWSGGRRPILGGSQIIAKLRGGAITEGSAERFDWSHMDSAADIVGWKYA